MTDTLHRAWNVLEPGDWHNPDRLTAAVLALESERGSDA